MKVSCVRARRAQIGLGRLALAVESESVAERLTEAAGAAHVAEQTAAVEQLDQHPTTKPAGPAVQQICADGAAISLVGGSGSRSRC